MEPREWNIFHCAYLVSTNHISISCITLPVVYILLQIRKSNIEMLTVFMRNIKVTQITIDFEQAIYAIKSVSKCKNTLLLLPLVSVSLA